jgi:hypothetical protein
MLLTHSGFYRPEANQAQSQTRQRLTPNYVAIKRRLEHKTAAGDDACPIESLLCYAENFAWNLDAVNGLRCPFRSPQQQQS